MIRRRGHEPENEESSSEEEDAFSALSRKTSKRQKSDSDNLTKSNDRSSAAKKLPPSKAQPILPVSLTSSMKRHHKPNEVRKAKMDALLQELEADKKKIPKEPRFVPEKKGSFVEPSEEHLTTNIFVGNLAPSITEEDITDLFLQFGDLYSVKIMWPRTAAEKSRKRHTGFVCFMNREDAEEAMEACSEKDPFNVGRQLMMRWGKNVKKNVRFGAGRMIVPTSRKKDPHNEMSMDTTNSSPPYDDYDYASTRSLPSVIQLGGEMESRDITKVDPYQASMHSAEAIHVEIPSDPNRFHFISTIASYVARDGSSLERALIKSEEGKPNFNFLTLANADELQTQEYIFYRWRVYSFCQGDRYSEWRADPFVMFHPKGRYWIPPPNKGFLRPGIPSSAAQKKSSTDGQEARTPNPEKKDFLTGRQFERAMGQLRKGNRKGSKPDGRDRLTDDDVEHFDMLIRKKLSISRESICRAMAFCFEKSASAKQIVPLLKEALLEDTPSTTIDHRIARLYLISDILFNSQQPGVKNAFMYRDALEKMAPEIFTALGKHGGNNVGRMTMNKLRKAVGSVLGAWTEWSVYNPAFLDELEARFEGREVMEAATVEVKHVVEEPKVQEDVKEAPEVITNKPQGGWTEVDDEYDVGEVNGHNLPAAAGTDVAVGSRNDRTAAEHKPTDMMPHDKRSSLQDDVAGVKGGLSIGEKSAENRLPDTAATLQNGVASLDDKNTTNQSAANVDDLDGSPLGDEVGAPIEDDIDGASIHEDVDGAPVEDDDIDGAQLEGGDVDGAPLHDALDGDPYDDVDGSPLEETDVSGKPNPPIVKHAKSPRPDAGDTYDVDGISVGAAELAEEGVDGDALDENVDGEALDEYVDGDVLDENVDGDALDDDLDGEEIDGEEI